MGDTATSSPIQAFTNKNVGTGKILTPSGLGIDDGNNGKRNYNITYVTNSAGEIDPKGELTVTEITTDSKTYDGTTSATLNGSATLVGVIPSDGVTVSTSTAVAIFNNKNVGTDEPVTVTNVTIGGVDAPVTTRAYPPTLNDGAIHK